MIKYNGIIHIIKCRSKLHKLNLSKNYFDNFVLDCTIEIRSDQNNITQVQYKQIELTGMNTLGCICDGDLVEVRGKESRDGILIVKTIYNYTISEKIKTKETSNIKMIMVLVYFFIFGGVLSFIINNL